MMDVRELRAKVEVLGQDIISELEVAAWSVAVQKQFSEIEGVVNRCKYLKALLIEQIVVAADEHSSEVTSYEEAMKFIGWCVVMMRKVDHLWGETVGTEEEDDDWDEFFGDKLAQFVHKE